MKRKVGALEKVDADLTNLQNKIGREPQSYVDDFARQYQQYETFLHLVRQAPASTHNNDLISFRDLVDFIAHVSNHYPKLTANFSRDLISLLTESHESLDSELRTKIVGSLVLLRHKDQIDSPTLLNTLFPILVATPSKPLRTLLYRRIVLDLRNANVKTTNHKLNRTVQTVLYNLVTSDRESVQAIWAVRITRELWRRQVWKDAKAVEIMKEAALAENTKVIVGGVNFFLGGDKAREEAAEDSSDDEVGIDMKQLRHASSVNKKSSKRGRELKNAAATVKKKERRKNQRNPLDFSALHLLHDPQSFAESLFEKHLQKSKSKLNLEQKLVVLQLVSRLCGLHKLIIMPLYSYFLKFLTPRQASVTSFLASLAQAMHNLVPPDAIETLLIKIANEFVSEAAAGQVAAAGLNAIREICARQPLAMNETLLQDLVMYRKSKDKGVMMAAKGLMSLYREVGPEKLKRRDRGKDASINLRAGDLKQGRFGEEVAGGIDGIELLEQWKEEERRKLREDAGVPSDATDDEEALARKEEEDWRNWDVKDDDSESSGGWIDVSSEGEDINISDSDDEKPAAKKAKKEAEVPEDTFTTKDTPTDLPDGSSTDVQKEISSLATTRILTPADLAKLNELRLQASVQSRLHHHKRHHDPNNAQTQKIQRHNDDPLTAEQIESAGLLGKKVTKEDKIASARGDREEEEKHKGRAAKRKERLEEQGKSTTNKDKARKKNFMMTLGKKRKGSKRSLREVGNVLKANNKKQQRGHKR